MKVYKHSNRTVGDKTYWKYSVNISNRKMDELEWDENTEVNLVVKDKKLIIERE